MAAEALTCPGKTRREGCTQAWIWPGGWRPGASASSPPMAPATTVHSSSNQASWLRALPLTTPYRTGFLGHPGFQARRSLSKEEAQRAAHGTRGERGRGERVQCWLQPQQTAPPLATQVH